MDTLGHMNNAAYLSLYEEARWEFITLRGFGVEQMRARQLGPVILECKIKFLREIRLRDKIKITVKLLDYKGKVGHLEQKMVFPEGSVASEAIFTFALFDLRQRCLVEPTPEWARAVGLRD
ncbi:MAG: thioesterase family protein [Bdellovibrionaceae bacterium]|nr:thioesterase family protein [Pseudobdellovibrionaceae bacterium]